LILKESQGLSLPTPFNMPLLSGEEVDMTGKAITFARLLHAFRRRYLLATFVGLLLASIVGATVWMMMPDNYEVTSLLQFTPPVPLGDISARARPESFDPAAFRATQQQLITSDIVISSTLLEPEEKEMRGNTEVVVNANPISNLPIFKGVVDKKSRLKSMISVMMPTGSDLMVIKLSGNSPVEQVKILKAVVRCYLRYQTEQEIRPITMYLAKLKKELDESTLNYRTVSGKYYEDLKHSKDPLLPEVQKEMELLRIDMGRAETQLLATDDKIREAEQQIATAKYKLDELQNKEYSDLLVENYYKEYDQFNEAKAAVTQAQKYFSEVTSKMSKNERNPQYQLAMRQVQEANKTLEEIKTKLRPAVKEKLRMAGDPTGAALPIPILEANLKQLEAQAQLLKERAAKFRNDYQTRSQAHTDLAERRRQMDELNSRIVNIERAKDDYDMKLKNIKETPRVMEINPPEVPSAGSGLYRVLFSGLAAVLCFMLGAGSIVLVESLKHRVNNLDEITLPGPGMRILGTIPNLGRIRGKSAETTSAVLAESIDTVRTMILQGKNRNLLHVILVTSAGESEGKTTVATHLAASLARAGRSTLLIDGDLRQPSIHLLFGMPQQAGFCEILRGETEIDDAVQPAQLEGLHLLQAGQCDHVALSMLVKEQGAELFQTLRSKFDYIVIDSGPVLGYADALQLGHYADAAVLSVLRDVSRLPMVYEAREQLEAVGVPILGAVVGRVASVQRTPVAA